MNNRYIITRSCLQEGSMRLLKYNESYFPQAGPAQFVDDQGREFTVQIDRQHMRIVDLGHLYHAHNLGVNDVMIFTPLTAGRYQVATIVKPHPIAPAPRPAAVPAPEPRRVVISSTPHVREIRLQRPVEAPSQVSTELPAIGAVRPENRQQGAAETCSAGQQTTSGQGGDNKPGVSKQGTPLTQEVAALFQGSAQTQAAPSPSNPTAASSVEDQVAVFAALTGYRLSYPASGLMRLSAELGPQHSYSVLLAADPLAMNQPVWEESQDEAQLLLTYEKEQRPGQAKLTREALVTLTEHARLTPMSPIDLRGYWRAGNLDLESAASVTELVSAHLAQRGAFSYVLMLLAKQPANSIIDVPGLSQSLGSGVNTAELHAILDTLSRPPFLALTPLQGGQYLLRVGVSEILGDLADYAQGIRRRVQPAANAKAGAVNV